MVTGWWQAARLFAASVLVLLGFVALNMWIEVVFPVRCADCHAHVGFPFAYYDEGGFAGDTQVLWLGLAGDIAVALGIAFGVVLAGERWACRKRE